MSHDHWLTALSCLIFSFCSFLSLDSCLMASITCLISEMAMSCPDFLISAWISSSLLSFFYLRQLMISCLMLLFYSDITLPVYPGSGGRGYIPYSRSIRLCLSFCFLATKMWICLYLLLDGLR